MSESRIKVAGIEKESYVDGPGIRFSLFTQGCSHHCPECHNPETHDPNGGYWMTTDEILKQIDSNPLLDGVTFSGGDPMEQAEALIPLAKAIKERGLNLVIFTGYLAEHLMFSTSPAMKAQRELLTYADILIDGPFLIKEKDLTLKFRGSRNQRIIDVPVSFVEDRVVIHDIEVREMMQRAMQ